MNIAVVGHRHWVKVLTSAVNSHCGQVARAVPMYGPGALYQAIPGHFQALVRVGYRPGARTWRGYVCDCACYLLQAIGRIPHVFYYWTGTDVLKALESRGHGRVVRWFADRARKQHHIAAAPWLAEELQSMGFPAASILFPGTLPEIEPAARFPDEFAVLSYIPDERPEFYGSAVLLRAAAALPQVRFHVAGGNGAWMKAPLPNVRFWGWTDLAPLYRRCAVVLRIVRHDALGGTVREALALGRHVLYTYPCRHTQLVPFADAAPTIEKISTLYEAHRQGVLDLNHHGREYALTHFGQAQCTRALVDHLVAEAAHDACFGHAALL